MEDLICLLAAARTLKLVSTHFGHSWALDEKIGMLSALSRTDSIEGIASANPQTWAIAKSINQP